MVNDSDKKRAPHRCSLTCLGPLLFHNRILGSEVLLREGGRLAEKRVNTFRNGVAFSSRPVKVNEKVLLRVDDTTFRWHGALRVGFTNVPPEARTLPLPCLVIPNLSDTPGHWAAPVKESLCRVGAKLEFWVSSGGTLHISSADGTEHRLLEGVDLSRPLWAMIDIYGQTTSVYLLGSERKGFFFNKKSCPAPKSLGSSNARRCSGSRPVASEVHGTNTEPDSGRGTEQTADSCAVCLLDGATVTLPCGHRCLCDRCSPRVIQVFNACPLCRSQVVPQSPQ